MYLRKSRLILGSLALCLPLCGPPVAAAAAAAADRAGGVAASQLRCGDVITTDTTLRNDVANCAGTGLVIGADDITLELNGHTISGDGTARPDCPQGQPCDVGVDNRAGHDGLIVRDGSIVSFQTGILSVAGDRARVRSTRIADNGEFGIVVVDSAGVLIRRNDFVDNGISGVVLFASSQSSVKRNFVSGSDGFAVVLAQTRSSRVQRNRIDDNTHGIAVQAGSSRNTVSRNLVRHSVGSSIDVGGDDARSNRVIRNRVIDNGDGIIVGDAPHILLRRNIVTRSGFFGDPAASGGFSVLLDGTDDATVDRNVVTGGREAAIIVTQLEAATTAQNNIVSRNIATSRLSDGILVESGAIGTRVHRNTASHNRDDGIEVNSPTTTVSGNTANDNRELGIQAVLGVTDGGGNTAEGNGDPAQCVGVTCS